ncbi:HYR-like domain-containing protein [Salinimicrobium sp. CAU 1759]
MIWKTTLTKIFLPAKNVKKEFHAFAIPGNSKNAVTKVTLLVAFLFFTPLAVNAQSSVECEIGAINCPPTDIEEKCGDVLIGDILGNYVNWTEPDYFLDCGDQNGYQYEISFDLPESQEECWTFSKVQRVGNKNGILQLWQSTGNTVNPVVRSPSFYINEIMDGSLDIYAESGQNFQVNVSLRNSDGVHSGTLTSFTVTGNNSTISYPFSFDPANFNGTGDYDGKVFRIEFEFVPLVSRMKTAANYVELITLDAGLFSEACAAEANFAVTQTHNPGDFFPVGTTEVTYTATCNGCVPVLTESCSFNVIVKPMPDIPVAAEVVQPSCDTETGSISITPVYGMEYNLNGGAFGSTILWSSLNAGDYAVKARNAEGCESTPLIVTINPQPSSPSAPEASISSQPDCDSSTGSISVSNIDASYSYSLLDSSYNPTAYSINNGVFSDLPGGTYIVQADNGDCQSTSEELTIVAFEDTEVPTITAPATVTVPANADCQATGVALGTPSTDDNCSVANVTNNAPATFELGNTTVTWTVTDGAGNTATATQTVTVVDNIDPTITAPATVTVPANAECQATGVALGTPVTADNCSVANVTNDAPATFELGNTTVTWTVTDGAGNTATATQTVTVVDNTDPTITAPATVTVPANADCQATGVALGTPSTDDNCSVANVTNNAPATFELGNTTVTWTVTDGAGNTATATQTVTVVDNTDPTITAPATVTVPANADCQATGVALGTPVTDDNCSVATVTNDAPATFELGNTTVTWTVTDGAGNTATATQTVTVVDNTDPTITAPATVTVPANADCQATGVALGTPVTADNCSVATVTNDAPATFELGNTTVTWIVTDGAGNTATATQTVTVVDNTDPTITAPATVTVPANADCQATGVALGTPVTADNCSVGSVTNDAPATFELGNTTVTWTVTDEAGNTATATQTVTVVDNTDPTITAPATVTVPANANCQATGVALGTPVTADNCSVGSVTNDAPATFELGNTTVTWTVTDGAGNTATATQIVTVVDNTDPTITAPATVTVPANADCQATGVALGTPTTADNCSVATVTNDAPATFELGNTTVTWTVTDGAGNTAVATQTVTVVDNTDPTITAPATVTVPANADCQATGVALGTPVTDDNCSVATVTNDAPATFELGNTTVTWTVTDRAGNTATATQLVTVVDQTAPDAVTLQTIRGNCEVTVNAPTTQDNCAGTITGTTSDPTTYSELGTYNITWTFDDGNGNTTTENQTVIVENNTAPVAPVLADAVAECAITVPAPTTTNACTGETLTGTTNDPVTYSEQGDYSITWTFDDGDGNIVTSTQNVFINDTTAPEAITLADVTGECEATVTAPTTTDNCAGTITATTDDPLTYTEQGEYVVTWTFDDGNGNITTVEQNVIVNDTTAPEAITLADVTGECEATVTAPTTTDNCSGTITATTNDALTYTEQGEYVVTWTFNDGNGNTTTVEQNVIVNDTTAPEAITLADVTGECEATVTAPTTTDNCSGTITATTDDALTYTEQGEYVVTWTFNDGNGNTTTVEQNVIVKDTTTPEAITIADVTGECEATVTAPTTTDNCAGTITATTNDALTYTEQGEYVVTWTFNDGNGNTTTVEQNVIVNDTTAPDAVTLQTVTGNCEVTVNAPTTQDNCAGTITGTTSDPTTYSELGTYNITWTFDDGNGNTTTENQTVIVENNTAPVAPVLADAVAECAITVPAPTTTNACTGETLTGTTNDPVTYSEQGDYSIIWTFDDGDGNIVTSTQNVFINDTTAPEAITLADVTGECEATVTAPTTTDNCAGTITATTDDVLTYTQQGEYVVTWTFDDGNGNTTTVEQNVIVNDTTAPEAITLADVTGECEATVTAPTTTDNCAGTITATTNDALTYTEQGEYVVTWTFDDGNGNTTTVEQNVIVNDTTAPEAITLADVTGECEATVTAPTTTDNCAGTITATTDDALTYTQQGEYVVTWTFDDGNGNTTTVEQNVIVNDTTAPEAITLADVTGECEATVTVPTTTDNCSGTITATTNDALTYTEQGEYVVTWTFNDGNGNTTTVEQNVIVNDTTAPEAITLADVTGECEATVTAPTTTDNCSGTITATTNDALTYTEQGEYVVTWTFNDGNGNITTVEQNVIVNDTTAPEAITLADVTGECEATVTAPTTTDNCAGTITATTDDALTYTEQGEYVVTWTFNDGNGNTTTVEQNVIVNDTTAPEAITLADVTGECEATVTAPTTTDNCAGTITATTNDALTYTEQGEYVVTWTFNDGNGNITTVDQNVIVSDNSAPVWTSTLPEDTTVSCSNIPEAPEMNAEDNCGVTIEFSEEIETTDCESLYLIIRTWIASDVNGNSAEHTQIITVDDTTAPTLVGELQEVINITCEEVPAAPELTFEDACSSEVTTEYNETNQEGENGSYVITRTWTVSDCAGNVEVFTQTVNVDPSVDPIQTTTADLCTEDSTLELTELFIGEYDTSGTWEDTMNTGALNNGVIDPALLAVGQYTFDYVINNGECSSTTTVTVSINDDCVVLPCEVEDIRNSISKAVTPNGDNINDEFKVGRDLDCGFTYSLKVFNRWGNEVFSSNNYTGGWDGTSSSSVTGDQLPSGTYFYIVEIQQSGFEPIQGYIYLGTK